MRSFWKKLTAAAVSAALSGLSGSAFGGGFGIGTQSGSGVGNAFAGGAAAADDASVTWFNPAGMTVLPAGRHVAGALHLVNTSFKFNNQGSSGVYAAPGTGEGGDGGGWSYIPNGFFAMDVNPRLRFGVAVNAPFGLGTSYDAGWRGQLTALKSGIKSLNINPSVAWKINAAVSIGGGVSVQKIQAELSNFAGAAGVVKLKADDVGYGFNLGLLAQLTPATRLGAAYRSAINYDLEGSATFTGVPALNGNVGASLKTPDTASLSIFHTLGPRWELMGDITWTGWSNLQHLVVVRTSGAGAGTVLTSMPFLWDDTLRYGVGANYKWSDRTKLRFGLAWDETPTSDATRTARLPDQRRTWIAAGVQYRVSKAGVLDVGFAHEFVKDASVNNPVPGFAMCAAGCLTGSFDVRADFLSLQYSHSF